jgi:CRP-like cAMP-binding protein
VSAVEPSVLAAVDLFAELSAEERAELAACLRRRRYRRGQVIFVRGDAGDSFYIVESGRVKIALTSPDGQELVLNLLGPADCFGELALLDGEPRSADAVAQEPTQLLLLRRDDFLHLLRRRPEAAIRLLALVTRWLRRLTQFAQDEAFLDVPARLARLLLELAEAHGRPAEAGIAIELRLTQADLAGMIGVTRRSVNKWLGFYARQGVIRHERGSLTVLRPDALRARIW